MEKFRHLFEAIRSRTSMYLRVPTYTNVTALVLGYDLAVEGGVLIGFREWLIPRVGGGNELSWDALVLRVAFPAASDPESALLDEEANAHAIEVLFDQIERFSSDKRERNGLRRIYMDYESWLRSQSWYRPGSPGWVDAPEAVARQRS